MKIPHGLRLGLALLIALAGCEPAHEGTDTAAPSQVASSQPAEVGARPYAAEGDIYVAESDGSNAVRIADGRPPNECDVAYGAEGEYWGEGDFWSPDRRYLAYRHTNCDRPGDRNVVISDPEGNVVAEFPGEGWEISWSPDSTRGAVWVRLFETIGIYGLDGVRQALFTVPPGWEPSGDHDPEWSPDGESLVLPGLHHAVEIPLDGSAPRRLP